jgi:hypothetical protein
LTTFFNQKEEGLDESTWSTRIGTPQLTTYEENIIPRGMASNNRYEGIPDKPDGLTEINYKVGKRAYIMKNMDWDTNTALHEDKIYGKSTLTRCKFTNQDGRDVKYSCVYKGIKWARLQYICEQWGVELNEVESE